MKAHTERENQQSLKIFLKEHAKCNKRMFLIMFTFQYNFQGAFTPLVPFFVIVRRGKLLAERRKKSKSIEWMKWTKFTSCLELLCSLSECKTKVSASNLLRKVFTKDLLMKEAFAADTHPLEAYELFSFPQCYGVACRQPHCGHAFC